jgi:hypothetical protein
MAGLTGITGLAPVSPVFIPDPGAPAEVIHGGPADPAHGNYLWDTTGYGMPWLWQPGVDTADASVAAALLGSVPPTAGAGTDPSLYSAPTETGSHAAPWPSFGTADGAVNDRDQAAARQLANAELHSYDTGDALARLTNPPVTTQMPWSVEADYVTAGQSILQPVPEQMTGQLGRDRVQGTPALNADGFDSAHVYRTRATGDVPGNFLWLDGRQRPMQVQVAGRLTYPVGSDTPFAGQVPGAGAVDGAVLTGLPPVYSAPPFPPSDAAPATPPAAPVWSGGW